MKIKISIPKIDKVAEPLKKMARGLSIYLIFLLFGIAIFFMIAEIGRYARHDNAGQSKDKSSAKEKNALSIYKSFVNSLFMPKGAFAFSGFLARDMFSKGGALPNDLAGFSLDSIKTERVPIVYNGYMNLDGSSYIAQVNKLDRTYFLKEGQSFDGLEVQDISEERIVFKSKNGMALILENSKPIYRKERVALISNNNGEGNYKIFKGALLKDYKIAQVGRRKVLLVSRINGKKVSLEIKK